MSTRLDLFVASKKPLSARIGRASDERDGTKLSISLPL